MSKETSWAARMQGPIGRIQLIMQPVSRVNNEIPELVGYAFFLANFDDKNKETSRMEIYNSYLFGGHNPLDKEYHKLKAQEVYEAEIARLEERASYKGINIRKQ